MKLAFTGHRPESLPFGENENDARCIRLKAMLLTEIMDRAKAGYDTFYTGCARGMQPLVDACEMASRKMLSGICQL